MLDAHLLSNGSYHVMLTSAGTGSSRWKGVAVTRWREDGALHPGGIPIYLRDEEAEVCWRATDDCTDSPGAVSGTASFTSTQHAIESTLTVAVAPNGDAELRRLRVTNRSSQRRTLTATMFAELVLAPATTDSAHPAFNKLFVETSVEVEHGAVIATRRPSTPKDKHAWLFHTVRVDGEPATASFETDRMAFIGRGRDERSPLAQATGGQLGGTVGPVLDACAASRVPLVLDAGASCIVDWWLGIAETREACVGLLQASVAPRAGDAVLAAAPSLRATRIRDSGAAADDVRTYERLASALVIADPALRGDTAAIAANRRGQSALWAYGISGDSPIVHVSVRSAEAFALVRQVVAAHSWWRGHGIECEVLFDVDDAKPENAGTALVDKVKALLAESVESALVDKRGGLVVRPASAISPEDRTLFLTASRLVIDSGRCADLRELLAREPAPRAAGDADRAARAQRDATAPTAAIVAAAVTDSEASSLVDWNGHGGFTADRRRYVVVAAPDRMTPAPWINVLANPDFGTLVDESGSSSTWSENSHEMRLTPWSNDPVGDASGEAIYLRDDDSFHVWSPTLLPVRRGGRYETSHRFGSTRISHREGDIESTLTVFVDREAPVKFQLLKLVNHGGQTRRLSATGIVEWVLGDERSKSLMHVVTEVDGGTGAVLARNAYNADFEGRTAFFDVAIATPSAHCSVTGDRGDFYGPGGTRAEPAAMADAELSGRTGAGLDPCAALRLGFEIASGAEVELVFRLGCARSAEAARALAASPRGAEAAHRALGDVEAYWQRTLGTVEVRTPDGRVDGLANGWLLYQVLSSRLWGRTAFYQSSGAYGFRDQLQDVLALMHCAPALVRDHVLRAASRQFLEGDVQHWWHLPSGKGIRTRCSDDYLWLPFVVARYVETTGDAAVLDEACTFLEADALKDGEQSSYSVPKVSAQSASLYEHCVRAVTHGLRYGAHGLPLMGAGDWNDGMDLVGVGGKGESVWLAFFLVAVLKRFTPLAESRGDTAFAARCAAEAEAVSRQVEKTSWDGAWYRRAYFDDGTPLGSSANSECRIDSIAQSWSVISGVAPPERATQAMASLHARLVQPDTRLVELLQPPFDVSKPSPGYIAGYVPGVRENGGQYTHGAMWAVLAYAQMADAERAWELFGYLDPQTHGATAADIARYRVEPYVLAGDVYSCALHAGRGGWTWYTGSAGWMYQLLLEALLGVERRAGTLRMKPLLPAHWPGFKLRYRYGGSELAIECRRAEGAESIATTIDGVVASGGVVPLLDDGRTRAILVTVGAAPA